MVEDVIEQMAMVSRRRKLVVAGALVMALVVLGVGLNTIASGFLKGRKPAALSARVKNTAPAAQGAATGDSLTDISGASFNYLMPAKQADWTLDEASRTYESKKGLVKYNLKLTNAGTLVTISQQAMPAALLPRDSEAFKAFVDGNKPTRSVDAGDGTVYFLPALQNGALANGADTVIYATDAVLLFGRAERVVGYDGWTKLIGAMKPTE